MSVTAPKGFRAAGVSAGLLAGYTCEDLPRRVFAETDGGVEVLNFVETVFRGHAEQVLLRDFSQTAGKLPRLFFQKPAADGGGFFALVDIDPVADFAARARGLYEREPVAEVTALDAHGLPVAVVKEAGPRRPGGVAEQFEAPALGVVE